MTERESDREREGGGEETGRVLRRETNKGEGWREI